MGFYCQLLPQLGNLEFYACLDLHQDDQEDAPPQIQGLRCYVGPAFAPLIPPFELLEA
jgi:hypothetical protein